MYNTHIELINLVPKFLQFLNQSKNVLDMEKKWKLWQSEYNFAAIPPTEMAYKKAKADFIHVYDRYLTEEAEIATFSPDESMLYEVVDQLRKTLAYDESITLNVVYFVGFFEHNPFVTFDANGTLCLCLPVEGNYDCHLDKIYLYHELTHILHASMSKHQLTYGRSLAFLLLQEGLAMRMSFEQIPGYEVAVYVSHQPGWYELAIQKHSEIVHAMQSELFHSDSDTLYKYTMGSGNTGIEREAYYVGWNIVGKLLQEGYSFSELMRLNEKEVDSLVGHCFVRLLDDCE